MVGQRIQVYNGMRFLPLQVNPDMVGHLVGEFAPTRKRPASKKVKKK
jgi:small subunit ribosomal protein S19